MDEKICSNCQRVYKVANDFLSRTTRWRTCDQGNLWFNCSCLSTLMLPRGKYPWFSPDNQMSAKAASLFNQLPAFKTMPHVRTSVMEIQQILQSGEPNLALLSRKVKQDPFLAVNILKVANGLKSGRNPTDKKPMESLEHAIVYMGVKSLAEIVLAVSLQSFQSPCKVFNVDEFWRDNIVVGNIAEHLAMKFQLKVVRDEIFLAGVLCNIGKLVAAICLPELLDKVTLHITNPKSLTSWRGGEVAQGSPDHCLLGEIGSALWGFPEYVVRATANHHEPFSDDDGMSVSFFHIVALANQMSHWVLLRPSRIDQYLLNKLSALLRLPKNGLDELGSELTDRFKSQV